MPSIERIGTSYRVRWREGGRGGKQRTSKRYKRRALAEAFRRELERRMLAERLHDHDGITPIPWEELVDRYCVSRSGSTTHYLEETRRYLIVAGSSKGWGYASDVRLDAAMTLPERPRRQVRALLRFAADLGQRIDPRVIPALRPKPRRRQPQSMLTAEEVAALIARASGWHAADGAIAHLVATYGHRVESVRELTPESLSARPGWLRLRVKSGDIHEHPLLPETMAILEPLAKEAPPGTPFLIGHLRKPWASGREFSTWWHHYVVNDHKAWKAARKAGEQAPQRRGAGILDLRRYAISRMMSATGDPKTVASITGHRTPSLLLNVYARTTEARQRAALEAIRAPAVLPPHAVNH